MHIEPVGGTVVVEGGLINGTLKARFILSKNLLIGHSQLRLVLLGLLLPIGGRSGSGQMLQRQVVKASLKLAKFLDRLLGLSLLLPRPIIGGLE